LIGGFPTLSSKAFAPSLFAMLLGAAALAGCNNGGQERERTAGGGTPRAQDATQGLGGTGADVDEGDSADDDDSGSPSTTKKKTKKKKTSSSDDDDDESDEDDDDTTTGSSTSSSEPDVYPKLAFKGSGQTTYKLKDKLAITQSIETDLTKERLTLTTTAAHVACGSLDGCKQNEVDDDVRAHSLGDNTYKRVGKSELEDLIEGGFQKASFAIFAKSAVTKSGHTLTFDKPLPVYFWPVAASRFDPLKAGPMTWTAHVTADRYIAMNPNLTDDIVNSNPGAFTGSRQARKEFTVTVTITKVSTSGDKTTVRLDVNIPEDSDVITGDYQGILYGVFPVPKSATYTIDGKDQVILGINLSSWSNGRKSKQREETNLNLSLCTKKTGSKTKDYPCS
jgi:hypothetical protein